MRDELSTEWNIYYTIVLLMMAVAEQRNSLKYSNSTARLKEER